MVENVGIAGEWVPDPILDDDYHMSERYMLGGIEYAHVLAFFEDGPFYLWIGRDRVGAIESQEAARKLVEERLADAA